MWENRDPRRFAMWYKGVREWFVQPFCCFRDDYPASDKVPPVGVEVIIMDAYRLLKRCLGLRACNNSSTGAQTAAFRGCSRHRCRSCRRQHSFAYNIPGGGADSIALGMQTTAFWEWRRQHSGKKAFWNSRRHCSRIADGSVAE